MTRLWLALGLVFAFGCSHELKVDGVGPGDFSQGQKVDIERFPDAPNSIYGAWIAGSMDASAPRLVPQVYLNNQGQVAFSMACFAAEGDGPILFATVDLGNVLQGNKFELSEVRQSVFTHDHRQCTMHVAPGTTQFFLVNGQLEMRNDQGWNITFHRLRPN